VVDHVSIEPDRAQFARVARELDREAGSTEWQDDLAVDLAEALEPGLSAVRGAVMAMSSGGLPHAGEPLRAAVAHQIVIDIRLGGGFAGARIRAKNTGMPRGFRHAPKRLNARSWRHPTRGGAWVTQVGEPGWFDFTLQRLHPRLRHAAENALAKRARRISRRV
jgi:hypothetical protein